MKLCATIRKALPHFTLEVELACGPGEMVALVGPSGAGKSTVLRCLAGLERLDDGAIHFGESRWAVRGRRSLPPQLRGVGLLAQDAPLFPHMSVFHNARFAAPKKFASRADIDALALLESLGIAHLRHHKPHEISGGERQRAALCQTLMRRPQLLLLDEPFSALDVENRLTLRAKLLEIKDRRAIPIILVTHDLVDGMAMADRVISLRCGREDPGWLQKQLRMLDALHAPNGGRNKGSFSAVSTMTDAHAASL